MPLHTYVYMLILYFTCPTSASRDCLVGTTLQRCKQECVHTQLPPRKEKHRGGLQGANASCEMEAQPVCRDCSLISTACQVIVRP